MSILIQEATPADAAEVHQWIVRLAHYERLGGRCVSSSLDIQKAMSGFPGIRAAFAMIHDEQSNTDCRVGFALWYYGFSSFAGRPVLYLEDIYVDGAYRFRGVGMALFTYLAGVCREEGCCRIQWSVLDANASAIRFYRSLGAQDGQGWSLMSLDPLLL
ncbi:MAG: GNAT family N-acetyltransferase [Spirochaetales bacterium]|nr:GNAT family N-acetyltransferase [Spirochaetales bacterium]